VHGDASQEPVDWAVEFISHKKSEIMITDDSNSTQKIYIWPRNLKY